MSEEVVRQLRDENAQLREEIDRLSLQVSELAKALQSFRECLEKCQNRQLN